MRRLVCVVEGHGECDAAPVLCHRIVRTVLGGVDWYVDEDPVRQPRSMLVDPSPVGLPRALALAVARRPDGILVLCDADDDCPASWARGVVPAASPSSTAIPVGGVMSSREYESWLLWGFSDSDRAKVKASNPERSPRDAKKALRRLVPDYAPTTHQLQQTRFLDLHRVWARSDSFDKLVRSLAALIAAAPPPRPKPSA